MKSPKKTEYHVGDWVRVTAIAESRHNKPEGGGRAKVVVANHPLKEPLVGQVVGASYMHEGEFREGHYYGGFEDAGGYEQGAIINRTSVLVYEVRVGFANKPLRVLPSALAPDRVPRGYRLPFRKSWRHMIALKPMPWEVS